jgi:hypothetical protein
MIRKIARWSYQAIFVDGVGRNFYPCAWAKGRTAFPMVFRAKTSVRAIILEEIPYQNEVSAPWFSQVMLVLPISL